MFKKYAKPLALFTIIVLEFMSMNKQLNPRATHTVVLNFTITTRSLLLFTKSFSLGSSTAAFTMLLSKEI